MTRLSIAFAAATLTLSLAPAANAYATEPTFTVTDAVVSMPQTAETGEICVSRISPELAKALALPRPNADARLATLACVTE